jgi:HEAT repeat protein
MKTMHKPLWIGAFALALLGAPAYAANTAVDASALQPAARTELKASIDRARATDAASFATVRDALASARASDAKARGRKAPVALRLSTLGGRALLPLLDRLVFDASPFSPSESASEHAAVVRDVIEAVGLLKDARALPVLAQLVARDADFATSRTAAEALGRLDRPEAASALVAALAGAKGEHERGLLAGMGACHDARVAKALADRLAAHPDAETAALLVQSLDSVGNAWAWKTLASRADEGAVRAADAKGLVDAYVHYTGDVRARASKALLVVDAPETPAMLEQARRGASPELAAALDEMARRFATNPTR